MITRKTRQFALWTGLLGFFLLSTEARCEIASSWIDPGQIMVVYNTTRMDSVDPAEPDTFSHDIARWYMRRLGTRWLPDRQHLGRSALRPVRAQSSQGELVYRRRWSTPVGFHGAVAGDQAVAYFVIHTFGRDVGRR